MLDEFYKPFHENVENTIRTTERVKGERILGVDPASGKQLMVKLGRFGPVAQIGEAEGDEKPRFARLQKDQLLETITLVEALELFRLPRELGEYEDANIAVAIGRFGPYLAHNKKFYSLPKTEDPYTVDYDTAIRIIIEKSAELANKIIKEFEYKDKPVQVLNGRYGPYISYDKNNIKIPKGTEPTKLTLEDCIELINNMPEPSARRKGGARKAKK